MYRHLILEIYHIRLWLQNPPVKPILDKPSMAVRYETYISRAFKPRISPGHHIEQHHLNSIWIPF